MKSQSLRNRFTAVITVLLIALSSVFNVAIASGNNKAGNETSVDVKYVGQIDMQPVFQLDVKNMEEDEMYITLTDEANHVLYAVRFKDRSFTKKFQINTADLNASQLFVKVAGKNSKKTQTFQISNNITLVEDVVVNKIER